MRLRALKKSSRLLVWLVALQSMSVATPYLLWFRPSPRITDGWFWTVQGRFSPVLALFWVWVVVIPLAGSGAHWSAELNDAFFMEAWRHPTYRAWLWRSVGSTLLVGAVSVAVGLGPLLLAFHSGQVIEVALSVALLTAYCACLTTMTVLATVLGAKSAHAFAGVLLFHVTNLALEGAGVPSVLRFFLAGEAGGWVSALVAIIAMGTVIAALLLVSSPATIMTRGSEFE